MADHAQWVRCGTFPVKRVVNGDCVIDLDVHPRTVETWMADAYNSTGALIFSTLVQKAIIKNDGLAIRLWAGHYGSDPTQQRLTLADAATISLMRRNP